MAEFPTEERLLGELVSIQPDTIERQRTMSRFLVDFAKTHGLGNVTPLPFPEEVAYGKQEPRRYNLMIDIPPPAGGTPEEILGFYAHFDVVPPSEGYVRKPNQLVRDTHKEHLWYGLGSGDMLLGVASILHTLKEIITKNLLWSRRGIRAILTCGEEAYSEGFHAARESGAFDGVHCVITPEILTNENTLRTDVRMLNEGRPGHYGITLKARGLEKHIGAVDETCDEPFLARSLSVIMWKAAGELRAALKPNPDTTGGLQLLPRVEQDDWGSKKKPSLTTPYKTWLHLDVHYAHHDDSPEKITAWTRWRCIDLAHQCFGISHDEAEKLFEVEHDMHGPDPNNVTPCTQPWKENHYHHFLREMRDNLMSTANAHCDSARYPEGKPQGVMSVVDTGVADCGLIANFCGIPVAGLVPPTWGAHTPHERIDIRGREYLTNVMIEAAKVERALAPPNSSL